MLLFDITTNIWPGYCMLLFDITTNITTWLHQMQFIRQLTT